ncbi:hypothetical protein [Umezawaea sp.]|uniref:hypothetical protein n=1 Tax=Umezawaea sp. TaxID=1955258 RepID=UPI002ECFE600
MTEPKPDEEVHQAFFGVSEMDSGHHMITCSLYENDMKKWRARLQEHTRLEPVQGGKLPASALSYLRFDDGSAAVVRRVERGFSQGRGNAHVLIGSASVLDVSLSLALAQWGGWRDEAPPGRPAPIRARALAAVAAASRWSPTSVRHLEDQLAVVLSRLLDAPGEPLSIIGCPDEDRLAVVWGLREAADEHLRRTGCGRTWSYSTYANRHDLGVRDLPEIVFLPEIPNGGVARRTVVDLRGRPEDSRSRPLACDLLDALLRGASAPPPTVDVVAGRQPRRGDSAPPHQAVRVDDSRSGHRMPNLGKQWDARLRDVSSIDELRKALRALGNQGREFRSMVRKDVDVRVVDDVADRVEAATGDGLRDLAHALYGLELEDLRDDEDAREHARKLIRRGRSGQFARVLGLAASSVERQDIAVVALERWDAGYPRPRRLKPQRARRPLGAVAVNRPLLAVAFAVVLAVLVAVFALGYATGRPEAATPVPDVSDVVPTSEPQPSTSARPAGRAVRVTAVDTGRVLYAFARLGEQFYPQQPCVREEDGTGALWSCAPTGTQPEKSELVAIEVPSADVPRLDGFAEGKRKITPENGWGTPVVVP